MQSLKIFFTALAILPNNWLAQVAGVIIDNTEQQQAIPAESPLELVVQIYLNVHDAVNRLHAPGKTVCRLALFANQSRSHLILSVDAVQATLQQVAMANHLPIKDDPDKHNGFSNCVFVPLSDPPSRNLIVGSTTMYIGHVQVSALTTRIANL